MRTRGFSLVESLLAMGLVLLVLGLVATLMREYSDVNRLSAPKDHTFDGVQFALREMRNELGSALEVSRPAPPPPATSTDTVLRFKRFDPALKDERLPYVFPTPAPLEWQSHDPDHTIEVTYELDQGGVVRRVDGYGTTTTQLVAQKAAGLSITRNTRRYFTLTLAFQEKNRLKTYSLQSKVWTSPRALNP